MGCVSSTEVSHDVDRPQTTKGQDLNVPVTYPIYGDGSIMRKKAHGTSETPVQSNLRWNCNVKEADRICNYNRRFAESSGE